MPAEVGRQYLGRVTEVLPEWVAVELASGEHALLHLTRILPRGVRLQSAVGVLAVGDHVRITVAEVNERRGIIGVNLDAKLAGDREISPKELVGGVDAG